MPRPFVVCISGPSGAGKSTLADGLVERLCGTRMQVDTRTYKKKGVKHFSNAAGNPRVSYVRGDSYWRRAPPGDPDPNWNEPELVDHGPPCWNEAGRHVGTKQAAMLERSGPPCWNEAGLQADLTRHGPSAWGHILIVRGVMNQV